MLLGAHGRLADERPIELIENALRFCDETQALLVMNASGSEATGQYRGGIFTRDPTQSLVNDLRVSQGCLRQSWRSPVRSIFELMSQMQADRTMAKGWPLAPACYV